MAVQADVSAEGSTAKISIDSLQNKSINPLYRVLIATSNGDYRVVKDWDSNSECSIPVPAGKSYSIKVMVAKNAEDTEPAWMVYSFE